MNICFFNLSPNHNREPIGMDKVADGFTDAIRKHGHRVMYYVTRALECSPGQSVEENFKQFLKSSEIDIVVWFWGYKKSAPFSLEGLPCKLVTVWYFPPDLDERFFNPYEASGDPILLSDVKKMIAKSKPCQFLTDKFEQIYGAPNDLFHDVLRISDKFVLLSDKFFSEFTEGKRLPWKICTIPRIAFYKAKEVSFSEKKKELLWHDLMNMPIKQPDLLLQVWQKLQDRFPDWSLRLVGRGPDLSKLKDSVKEFGLKNISVGEIGCDYLSASIFCMTSKYEGFPRDMIEAMSYGCVPVAFDSFIMARDVINDGVNGYLATPFDVDAYAEKLAQLMQDSTLRERLGSAVPKSVSRFSLEAVSNQWEELLYEIG